MDQLYDYLIALNVVTCPPEKDPECLEITTAEEPTSYGRIIQISWGTYDVQKKIVLDECQFLVKPYKFTELPPETVSRIGITNEEILEKGTLLSYAMYRFNETLYVNCTSKNASFCVVTSNDNILTAILPKDTKEAGIKLASHFFFYFNIMQEFKKRYKVTTNLNSPAECLTFLKLKETQGSNLGQIETKSILRLCHRLTSDGHKFQNPYVLDLQHQLITERIDSTQAPFKKKTQNKKQTTLSLSSSPESICDPSKKWFIRIRGLPKRVREAEIITFLRGIMVYNDDINFHYDSENKFTGQAFVQLHNGDDFEKALSFNLSELDSKSIEVLETNEDEFNKAKLSQNPEKKKMNVERRPEWNHLLREDLGILRIGGLPRTCTEEDIRSFFKGFNIVEDGIKRPIVDGKPSSGCFVVFESKKQAFSAMSLNMEKIGNKFIELFPSEVKELESFLSQMLSRNGTFANCKENTQKISSEEIEPAPAMTDIFYQKSIDLCKSQDPSSTYTNEIKSLLIAHKDSDTQQLNAQVLGLFDYIKDAYQTQEQKKDNLTLCVAALYKICTDEDIILGLEEADLKDELEKDLSYIVGQELAGEIIDRFK